MGRPLYVGRWRKIFFPSQKSSRASAMDSSRGVAWPAVHVASNARSPIASRVEFVVKS